MGGDTVSLNDIASLVLAGLTIVGAIIGVVRFVSSQVDGLRREIISAEEKARLLVEKAVESESKQRHSLASNIATQIARIELDVRQLSKETVRQEQMEALEGRLQTALDKIELKLEKLSEATAEMISIRQQLVSVNNRLERISDRLDESGGVMKNTRIG